MVVSYNHVLKNDADCYLMSSPCVVDTELALGIVNVDVTDFVIAEALDCALAVV